MSCTCGAIVTSGLSVLAACLGRSASLSSDLLSLSQLRQHFPFLEKKGREQRRTGREWELGNGASEQR